MELSLGPKPELNSKKIDDLLKLDAGGPLIRHLYPQACI